VGSDRADGSVSSTGEDQPRTEGDPQNAPAGAEQTKKEARPDVVKAVVERYYTRGLDAVDRSRQRAERGYTIASAIAAALVAAGLLTHLEERPTVVQVLALTGLSLWLVAALLFMVAVAIKVKVNEPSGYDSWGAFINGIAQQLRDEIRIINGRLLRAVVVTGVATAITIAALCYGVSESGASASVPARVELNAQGNEAVSTVCGHRVGLIYATVSPDSLGDPVVALKLPAGECGPRATVARVRKDEVAATYDVNEFPTFPQG
jgi:hypothetical protein